ncbi:hypothetical protein BDB00DRAFT_808229 [Zychaea mexicana]|uniref:uncharacterized protein n=1 Tax=Zychaea mexicana TaxID=64656 RepID=UPI0022FEE61C|nr:uncharacterized protein BDB00DRAFT_808229 [Zychaea mexicana]KAI9496653.1 hypothetical protein BDB00DRAFT_808229 [Zychaea mexicana]
MGNAYQQQQRSSWVATLTRNHNKSSITSSNINKESYKYSSNNRSPSIYRLPDEVLLYLLQCPIVDFNTLCSILHTSKRLRHVACQVFRYNLLPYIRLATVIDQEGRGRWTCIYAFDTLNESTLHASFTPINYKGQRYRYDPSTTNAPTLRYILAAMTNSSSTTAPSSSRCYYSSNEPNASYTEPTTIIPTSFIRSSSQRREYQQQQIDSNTEWLMVGQSRQIHQQQQRIINNPNRRLSIKQHRQRVVQETLNSSTAILQPCGAQQQQEHVVWRLSYIVNTMQQQDHKPSCLSAAPPHLDTATTAHTHNTACSKKRTPHEAADDLGDDDYTTTTLRYMVPVSLTADITALSEGFTQHQRMSPCRRWMNQVMTFTWLKRRKWCLNDRIRWSS